MRNAYLEYPKKYQSLYRISKYVSENCETPETPHSLKDTKEKRTENQREGFVRGIFDASSSTCHAPRGGPLSFISAQGKRGTVCWILSPSSEIW